MEATVRRCVVGLGLLVALFVAVADRATASDNTYLASVAAAVDSAPTIGAWRLSCRDKSGGIIHYGVESVIERVADLDSIARVQLAGILRAGSRDTAACYETRCGYCPAYRLIINDREPPIVMIVTSGCTGWLFTRAGVRIANNGACFYLPDDLIGPLKMLLTQSCGPEVQY